MLSFLTAHPYWRQALNVAEVLQSRGFLCFLAGGCVRDALLGKVGKDLDLATNALPEQIESLFPRTLGVGKSFGVIRVLFDGGGYIEVATFRKDGSYQDGRHPDSVIYSTYQEDAKRRDFTINALFFDLKNNEIIDVVGGLRDLDGKCLRAVGNATLRFQEDRLRIFRALRFVSQLGFDLESLTMQAIQRELPHLKEVSRERFRDELLKLLKGTYLEKAFSDCEVSGFLKIFFPFHLSEKNWLWLVGAKKELSSQDLSAHLPDWLYLACFFLTFSGTQKELHVHFQELRLSREDMKNLGDFFSFMRNWQHYRNCRQGEIVIMLEAPGVRASFLLLGIILANDRLFVSLSKYLGFSLLERDRDRNFWEKFEKKWRALGKKVPNPLLRGEHLAKIPDGPQKGALLRESHIQQIEENWSHLDQALAWLESSTQRV